MSKVFAADDAECHRGRLLRFWVDRQSRISDSLHMLPFSTEFPVRPSTNRAVFVAEVVAWIRGMQHQTVLSSKSEAELDGANVHVRSASGEELRMRELQTDEGWSAIGIRHDLPDDLGRVWRTECVLKRAAAEGGQDLVRLRTQCIATTSGAQLDTPRKPYLIKALLKNGWGGKDQQLSVTDRPVWLENNAAGLASDKSMTLGEAAKWLPTVYVSATGTSAWLLSQQEIVKLAYDLGGIVELGGAVLLGAPIIRKPYSDRQVMAAETPARGAGGQGVGADLDERRRSGRTTVCEISTLEVAGQSIAVEVVDISSEGARIDQPLNLSLGTQVRLCIATVDASAKVAWSSDLGTGIEFAAPSNRCLFSNGLCGSHEIPSCMQTGRNRRPFKVTTRGVMGRLRGKFRSCFAATAAFPPFPGVGR